VSSQNIGGKYDARRKLSGFFGEIVLTGGRDGFLAA